MNNSFESSSHPFIRTFLTESTDGAARMVGGSPAARTPAAGTYVTTDAARPGQAGTYVTTNAPRTGWMGSYVSTAASPAGQPGSYVTSEFRSSK